MKSQTVFIFSILAALLLFKSVDADSPQAQDAAGRSIAFNEVWGYLMKGGEGRFRGDEPITDICYFSVGVNYRGRLTPAIKPPDVKNRKTGKPRVHLVITDLTSKALMHFCLNPSYGVRDRLIGEIVDYSRGYDGVQIDFESIAADDAAAFFGFLKELKKRLPDGIALSVAVPARRRSVYDAYSYQDIASIADRVIIMAYDQHWSGSEPGPVASLSWCRDVLDYSLKYIPGDKLVMGLPLYGRAWQDRNYSRALYRSHVDEIIRNEKTVSEYSIDRGPSLSYEKTVQVKIYYEDSRSIVEKLSMYAPAVRSIAFWRLGMENGELWTMISVR